MNVLEDIYCQIRAINIERREPCEIRIGVEQWQEICLLPRERVMFAGLTVLYAPPRLFGLPLRILPIRSCLEVVP